MHAFDIEFALKFGRCAGVTTTSTGIKTDVDVVKATSNSALEVFERSEPFRQPSEPYIGSYRGMNPAKAFYNSKVWTDLKPERDKAQKTVRRYIVEVEP